MTGKDELYRPIVDRLARDNAPFDALLGLPAFGEERLGALIDCLTLLVHSGQVLPVPGPPGVDARPAQRFNRMVVESLRGGRSYHHLAAPVVRTGLAVPDFGLLALAAWFEGKHDAPAAARYALPLLKSLGRRPVRDGRVIESDGEAEEFLTGQVGQVLQDYVPLWRRLGCLPDYQAADAAVAGIGARAAT